MPKVEFVRHKDKEMLFIDFSNGNHEEILLVIAEAKIIIARQPEHSLLTLTDVTNAKFNFEVGEALKAFTAHNKPHVLRAALVGVTGLRKVLYNAAMQFSGRHIPIFNTLEQAKDWLVSQED